MICFDANIVIYIAQGKLSKEIAYDGPIICPSVVRIEALGYHNILSIEEQKIKELLATLIEVSLTENIIELAIRLRQGERMGLGDAIVAATAIENDCELWTANTEDFAHIDQLRLRNPLNTA